MSAGYLDLTKHQAYSNCASDETWTTTIIVKSSLISCAQLNSTQRTALFFYLALIELHMILLLKLFEVLCGDSLLQYRLHVHLLFSSSPSGGLECTAADDFTTVRSAMMTLNMRIHTVLMIQRVKTEQSREGLKWTD